MFEIIMNLKNGEWIDISGVSDIELFNALSVWSSGKEKEIRIQNLRFKSEDISSIKVSR